MGNQSRKLTWFSKITGVNEQQWRKVKQNFIIQNNDKSLSIRNATTNEIFDGGRFFELNLGELMQKNVVPKGKLIPLEILTKADYESSIFVDVAHLQMNNENKDAVFQVASNFNAIEAISETKTPGKLSFS